MLDIKFIRENKDLIALAIKNKKVKEKVDLDKMIALFDERQNLKKEIDELNHKRNEAARQRLIEEGSRLKKELAELEKKFEAVSQKFMSLMLLIPNVPSPDTPVGEDETHNKVLRQWGTPRQFDFQPKNHMGLGVSLGLINNERATLVSGTRFSYLKGDLVLMQFALINYAFSILTNKKKLEEIAQAAGLNIKVTPFVPIIPPVMIKPAVLNRMARLEPRDERYHIPTDDLYLIGSAEHSIGPMHMDETFEEADLPVRYVGYSTAFRREAGSYGKDTHGIFRVHQFDKMEMETFCLPENSFQEQEFLVAIQEYLVKSLNLPYQAVILCTGDMGLPDYRQIDIETWMPGEGKYRETHSADLVTSFQPRRLNTKVKRSDPSAGGAGDRAEPVHMNDATVFAGRTLIAILENYQCADGTVEIPEVLRSYMGKNSIGHER